MRPMKFALTLLATVLLTATALADKVDAYVREEMKERDIPGVALTVIKNGKRIKTETFGFANLEHKVPVKPETAFEIGSVTKQFTSAAIMLLVQDGKLSLDDKISAHLKNTPPQWSKITIRHLLTHTSGIKSYTGIDKGFEFTEHLTQEQFIKLIGTYPLEYQPGDSWKYCNTTYNLLGFIIENLSGNNYWEFLGERIFTPLGMNNTTNRNPNVIIPNRAAGYEKNKAGDMINRDYDLTDVFSAGAVVSTLADMSKWDAALNTNQILSEASKNEMWTVYKLNNGTDKSYGLGWYVDTLDGHNNIGHSGSTSGFSASFQRFPDDKLTILIFCNSGEGGIATKLAKEIAAFYFNDGLAKK
jgi:D-alanyl-D-alanine carboxypeptidase